MIPRLLAVALCMFGGVARAEAPVASYIFPAGGQRGATVPVRVGGLFLNKQCGFEMLGRGVEVGKELRSIPTLWFEGPLLPLPDSQQAEDYPKDMAGSVRIAADADLGLRPWRLWTSQGATPSLKFMVGDLPEIVEQEIEGAPVPVEVKLPVTINGRIFPRENVDIWAFHAQQGQAICCEVWAARLGSPLDSRIEVRDPQGRCIAENDDFFGADSFLRFVAPVDGIYQVRIHDVQFRGGPAYVYRLTLTTGPHVDCTYPLGGKRGSTVKLELAGQGLPAGPVAIDLPADGLQDHACSLPVQGQQTNRFFLDLDDLPEYVKTERIDTPQKAMPVTVPAVLNGRITTPGEADHWAVPGRKGEEYLFEVRARVLGSPLYSVLIVSDENGKELARSTSDGRNGGDAWLRFKPPADGTYIVRVQEQFPSRGSPAHAYRLRVIAAAAAPVRLRLVSDAVTLPRGGQVKLKLQVEPPTAGPLQLEIEGLPEGVTAVNTALGMKAGSEITLKADLAANIGASRLKLRVKDGTEQATLPLGRGEMEVDSVLLAVAMPTPFKVVGDFTMRWAARGTVYHRRYRIERNGFEGPLEITLADRQMRHLQGVTAPTVIVPAAQNEFDYFIHLPPWMETGRTCRACIMARGIVKDADGSEQVVTWTSVQPNEQFILVVEPEKLSVLVDRASVRAAPGETISLAVQVSRGKLLQGPVKVELRAPPQLRGLSADPVSIPADQDRATLTLRFAGEINGPFNAPIVLRATLLHENQPIIAETKVEVLPKDVSAK